MAFISFSPYFRDIFRTNSRIFRKQLGNLLENGTLQPTRLWALDSLSEHSLPSVFLSFENAAWNFKEQQSAKFRYIFLGKLLSSYIACKKSILYIISYSSGRAAAMTIRYAEN